jgi:pimeloyl-ACP methyl ester carboxylesterase
MQRSRQDGTVGVSGGRSLSYHGYGPPDGQPVLFFPGTPGSAVEWSMWPSGSAERSGIRVIAVDRPGLGWSDWQPRRRVLDWPVDVTALADALRLQRFAVLGYSGGVPYALACGQLLPDRVSAVTLVGCVGPDEEPGLVAGLSPQVARMRQDCRRHPRRAWLTWAGVRFAVARYPEQVLTRSMSALPDPDRAALAEPGLGQSYLQDLRTALRQGPRGAVTDMALMASPWGLRPELIRAPVRVWQGEQDRNAPPVMARRLAAVIPDCTATFCPDDGHLSIIGRNAEAMLSTLG